MQNSSERIRGPAWLASSHSHEWSVSGCCKSWSMRTADQSSASSYFLLIQVALSAELKSQSCVCND